MLQHSTIKPKKYFPASSHNTRTNGMNAFLSRRKMKNDYVAVSNSFPEILQSQMDCYWTNLYKSKHLLQNYEAKKNTTKYEVFCLG